MNQEDSLELLQELTSSIKNRGIKKTINLLKFHVENEIVIPLDVKDKLIIDTIADKFKIDINEIIDTKYLRNDHKYIIGFCVYYLYRDKTLKQIQKTVFKNKTKTLLSRYKQLIINLKKEDIKYFQILKDLDKILN